MDHSWRPPPPQHPGINTTVCPICSISHFPFCPLPPSIENPRFHYSQPHQIDYYHQRPPISHNYHHPPPFQNHQDRNYYHNPSDGHGTWYGTLNMNPYDGIRDPSTGIRNHPGGGPNYGVKRMKFDNNMGPLMGGETSRFPSENERILKLIHDHGKAANTTPPTESNGSKRRHEEMSKISSMGMASLYGNNNVLHYDQTNERGQSKYETPLPHPSDYTSQPANSFGTSFGPSGSQPSPPPRNNFFEPPPPPPPNKPSLFPVTVSSSVDSALGSVLLEKQQSTPLYYRNNASQHASPISSNEEFHSRQSLSDKHARDIQPFQSRHLSSEKQNTIDASHIFKLPHRASRPDHFVIILRGLPGSGKSYLAKLLRDIEIENGGVAPRIHSMDDYFMIEVEKAEDSELSNLSGSLRGKRQVMKTVMEYCYEPDMEEAYRASMLKAFKKTLDEGDYSFIIVDDRNLRVADFAQFWATAKRSGYEVYLVEASYKDPVGCAARNVHNFTLPDVQKMAGQWEEAPSLYLRMDIKSLLHGEGFDESDIQEVDMDMEDEDASDDETRDEVDDSRPHGIDEAKVKLEEVNDLSRSKWSNDLDAEEEEGGGGGGGKKTNSVGALSGLIQAYSSSKEAKSVCWGDQGGNDGFSISATRKTNTRSLVIGPGPGYNLKSNPLSEDEHLLKAARNGKSQNVFQQQTRAERESFKAVFDKRRLRIVDED